VAFRLADQALTQIYKTKPAEETAFPLCKGGAVSQRGDQVVVTIAIRAAGKNVSLTTEAPPAATRSSTLGLQGRVLWTK